MHLEEVTYLPGGSATDERGTVSYANGFPLGSYKRFYTIQNHEIGFVRAWHGHKYESKAYFVLAGQVVVGAVKIDDWDNPSVDCKVETKVMTADSPGILFIPGGYANGFMSLTADAKVILFSDFTLEQSKEDDIRFDSHRWNPWEEFRRTLIR